jgi:transcription termination/antitermination protein NusG
MSFIINKLGPVAGSEADLVQAPRLCGEAGGFPWFALRVKPNAEWMVSSILRAKGFSEFLPIYKATTRWSDRVKQSDKPLFPGYVFCRFSPDNRLPILSTAGVVHIVGVGKTPMAVDDQEIESIGRMVRSGLLTMPWPYLQAGEIVLVEQGPLAGLEGVLIQVKSSYRIVVSIDLLQRSIATEVDRQWVRPLRRSAFQGDRRRTAAVAFPLQRLRVE